VDILARQVTVIEDQNGDWLVEYSDAGGGRYVTIFAGPEPERRARDYFHVLKTGVVQTGIARRARKTCQLGTGNKEYRSCAARHLWNLLAGIRAR
jgi:hypothetical protein